MKTRQNLREIYTAAINAVNPKNAIESHVKLKGSRLELLKEGKSFAEFDLDDFERILVVGAGKATSPMARAIEKILGKRIESGLISVKYGYTEDLAIIKTIEASHPVPDENGVKGASEIRDILKGAGKNDLVISLISGGGSALLPLPPENISLDEKRAATDLLLKSGAAIHEINAVRKHLSLIKGGNMAAAAYPATVINLMISDVVGDSMDVIASGPFIPDNSRFAHAVGILDRYGLTDKVPVPVKEYLKKGAEGKVDENPDSESEIFRNVTNLIVASNIISLKAAKEKADELGYNTVILSSQIEGITSDVAVWHSRIANEVLESGYPAAPPACIISGGETTVVVKGSGLGGRNMEFAIQSAGLISDTKITMASIGTDGSDGPTDAAGAVADGSTVSKAQEKGIDIQSYIENNDSYHFFKAIDDLIITGPTNTNVMDVRIVIVED
jgi:hydroxypyruvate reductase